MLDNYTFAILFRMFSAAGEQRVPVFQMWRQQILA